MIIVVSATILDSAPVIPPNSTTSTSPEYRVVAVAEWYILDSLRVPSGSETWKYYLDHQLVLEFTIAMHYKLH